MTDFELWWKANWRRLFGPRYFISSEKKAAEYGWNAAKAKAEAEVDRLKDALDGLTTVAEILIQERAINGSLAIQGWCKRARNALEGKP